MQKQNETVRLINASTQGNISLSFERMAKLLEINKNDDYDDQILMEAVYGKIIQSEKSILLIFDGAISFDAIKLYIENLPKNVKALITTRDKSLFAGFPEIQVKPFSHKQAEDFIKNSSIKNRSNQQDINDLIQFCARGDTKYAVPYYLNRAVSIISARPTGNIRTYLDSIGEDSGKYDENETKLIEELLKSSSHGWKMLQYSAFLDSNMIDIEIFKVLFNVNEKELDNSIKKLESLSLMQMINENGKQGLSLHSLTQAVIKNFISDVKNNNMVIKRIDILKDIIQCLNKLFPLLDLKELNRDDLAKAVGLMPHVIQMKKEFEKENIEFEINKELTKKIKSYNTVLPVLFRLMEVVNLVIKLKKYQK
jgi:hypothetical protein